MWNLSVMVTLGTMPSSWLLYRGGLLIEVGGALGLGCISGWTLGLILLAGILQGDLPNQVQVPLYY